MVFSFQISLFYNTGRFFMYRKSVQWVFFFMLVGVSVSMAEVKEWVGKVEVSFHVAPDGNDNYEGTKKRPFASFERARDAVRNLGPEITGDILIEIAPGDYFRQQTFVLEPQDSGRGNSRVVYRGGGIPGSARLVGGNKITDWESVDGSIFRAKTVPGQEFNTLYENGIRARKARFPNYEFDARFPLSDAPYLVAEGGAGTFLTWTAGDLNPIADVDLGSEANLVVWPWAYCDWAKRLCRILKTEPAQRRIDIMDINEGTTSKVVIGVQARYYIEGVRDLLDAPGEFFLDTVEGWLYYWPRFGIPVEQEIIAPTLRQIVSLKGESNDKPVRGIVLEGFTFTCTDTFPYSTGDASWPFPCAETSSGPHGMVHLRYTRDVEIRFNHIKDSGMNGIYLERSNKSARIYGNWIQDCGISGIVFAYHRQARQFPNDSNSGNLIENNLIHGLGTVAVNAAGISLWGGSDNVITHCEIFDGVRYGISLRGPYTQLNGKHYDSPIHNTNRPITENNRVEYTHLYRLGQDSGDTAAMHMAGISSRTHHPVNYLKQLLIEDIAAHPSVKDMPPEGIYFDYTIGVTDQVLRDIEIRRVLNPFRTNRTDLRHTYDNVSWLPGFDPSRMAYDRIGLKDDFPTRFRAPNEVLRPTVREQKKDEARRLTVSWELPDGDAPVAVVITAEGVQGFASIRVANGQTSVEFERPDAQRPFMFRLQTVGGNGQRSAGVLIPAAERPEPVTDITVQGTDGAIDLRWMHPAPDTVHFLVAILKTGQPPLEVPVGQLAARIAELENDHTYSLRIDQIDADGYIWRGEEFRATAGQRIPVPRDTVAYWTFDEEPTAGEQVPGRFLKAVQLKAFDFICSTNTDALAIGTGDYAVSLWIRRSASTHMSGRIFAFGGGTRGPWEHWGAMPEEGADLRGLNLSSSDFSMEVLLNDGVESYDLRGGALDLLNVWNHVVVNIKRDRTMTLWLNGSLVKSINISASAGRDIPAAERMTIGRNSDHQMEHPNLYWTGAVDQLRIYRRALTVPEIAALCEER